MTIATEIPRVNIDQHTATVSLVDDDGVYVSLIDSEHTVMEDGPEGAGGVVNVCVEIKGIIERDVTLNLVTEPGTADGKANLHVYVSYIMRFLSLFPIIL